MTLEKMANRVIDTDVLVIGGGIAGCPAAIKAVEHGLHVTLVEKAMSERSGSAAQGIDHYGIFPRQGVTPLELVRIYERALSANNGEGLWGNPNIMYRYYNNAFWGLEEMEKLDIPMKWDDGQYYWMSHRGPGMDSSLDLKLGLRVHWQNVKPQMAKAARKKGVNVLDRIMIINLLTNNSRVVGATAVDTRTGEFIIIKAKASIVATGAFARCYDPETPLFWKYKFRYHWCPSSVSGDGWALAYRAGAELCNMEITGWGFRIRDDLNISFGNFPINDGIPAIQFTWSGEPAAGRGINMVNRYANLEQQGKTPIYYSLEHLPDDFQKRIEVAFVDERLVSFKVAEDRGFNPRTHWFEIMPNKPHNLMTAPGINVDENFKASLPGLYSIGDCTAGFHSCGEAVVSGLLVGDNIVSAVNEAGEPVVDETQVERQKQEALAPLAVKDGTEPLELESAIRYICERYVGQFKSEGKLREGLRRLGSLRREFLPKLIAQNPHYLMRCWETRNIMDLTELHLQACLARKETRGSHIRLDYPERDVARDSMLTYQHIKEGGRLLEIRKAQELKPEYAGKKN